MTYRFTEHDKGYKIGSSLQPWRPQFYPIITLIDEGSTVLDAGCGDGVLGQKLIQEKKCRVWGFDLDPVGVMEAKRKGIAARAWDANKKFPYKNRQFDVVICNELLEFCDNPDHVISECLRVGKQAIIEFPNFGFIIYRLELLLGRFPHFALYGHQLWETRQTKFFTFRDILSVPALRNATINKIVGINWRNRNISLLGSLWPNLFARSVILKITA